MKVDTRDKKPKVFSIAAISVIAAVLFTIFAVRGGDWSSLCISLLLCAYLAGVAGILIGSFFRQVQYNPYSYNTIYYAGFGLFVLAALALNVWGLVKIAGRPDYYSAGDFIFVIMNSAKLYIYYTSPLIVLFAAALVLSNLILIRREGAGLVNALGFLMAIALAGGVIALALVDFYPFSTPGRMMAAELVTAFFGAVYLYMECMLVGAAAACLLVVWHDPPPDRDYLIVLGCGLRPDGTPTPLLRGRLDRALEFWRMQGAKAGFAPVFVTSGGQGPDEVVPESTAMKRYLMEQGVPEDQILEEDRSTNTFENMKFSREKILERMEDGAAGSTGSTAAGESHGAAGTVAAGSAAGPETVAQETAPAPPKNLPARVAFSTTNYHEFRSGIYARRVKMRAEGICSPTRWYFWPNAWVREFIGVLTEHRGKQALVLGAMIVFYVALGITAG